MENKIIKDMMKLNEEKVYTLINIIIVVLFLSIMFI
tara:strand:- start:62 stop:169 length:108 start_codon:yes stop_codon:yes gene_type:complete